MLRIERQIEVTTIENGYLVTMQVTQGNSQQELMENAQSHRRFCATPEDVDTFISKVLSPILLEDKKLLKLN